MTLFSEEAEKVLGATADEVGEMLSNDPEEAARVFDNVNFKQFVFKCKAKMETYNVSFPFFLFA